MIIDIKSQRHCCEKKAEKQIYNSLTNTIKLALATPGPPACLLRSCCYQYLASHFTMAGQVRSIFVFLWAMRLVWCLLGLHRGSRSPGEQCGHSRHASLPPWKLNARGTNIPLRQLNATDRDLSQAQAIINQPLAEASILNAACVANPRRNDYNASPFTMLTKKSSFGSPPPSPPPLLEITGGEVREEKEKKRIAISKIKLRTIRAKYRE